LQKSFILTTLLAIWQARSIYIILHELLFTRLRLCAWHFHLPDLWTTFSTAPPSGEFWQGNFGSNDFIHTLWEALFDSRKIHAVSTFVLYPRRPLFNFNCPLTDRPIILANLFDYEIGVDTLEAKKQDDA
jgi:hypothetical protein